MKFARPSAVWRGLGLVTLLLPALASAQYRGGRGYGGQQAYMIRDPQEIAHLQEMEKVIDPAFAKDVFVFPRLIYASPFGRGRMWDDDSPDAELNLQFRLYQITSLKVFPGFKYINITAKELSQYPFVYMTARPGMELNEGEARALREYLLHGGFLMAEDFWGESQWRSFYTQVKRIFPDREPVPIGLENPIFHAVFDFHFLPQMPSVGVYLRTGQSWDPVADDFEDHAPHYFAIYDDKNRMMMLICQNNHFGDGWEHEGDDYGYFDVFSKPQAYPMFINILFYAMSH